VVPASAFRSLSRMNPLSDGKRAVFPHAACLVSRKAEKSDFLDVAGSALPRSEGMHKPFCHECAMHRSGSTSRDGLVAQV